tara:strand:- start:51 stop:818 length:768 start_codon:yes stop_codon:yes gene_type:complete
MKKLLIILAILAVVFIGLVYFVGGASLNKGIQAATLKFGPPLTGTEIELAGVHISPLSGSGVISGLLIGNPEGFKTEKAFSVTKMEIKLSPKSLLSDTIEIERILIDAPEIILERANGTTNLQQIQDNIAAATASGDSEDPEADEVPAEEGEPIKLSIKEFVLSNANVSVSILGQSQSLNLPTLRLTDLGTEQGGVSPDEIAKEVMKAITRAVGQAVADMGTKALQSPDLINDVSEKLGGFLNRKDKEEEPANAE